MSYSSSDGQVHHYHMGTGPPSPYAQGRAHMGTGARGSGFPARGIFRPHPTQPGVFQEQPPYAVPADSGGVRAYQENQGMLSEEEAMQLAYAQSLSDRQRHWQDLNGLSDDQMAAHVGQSVREDGGAGSRGDLGGEVPLARPYNMTDDDLRAIMRLSLQELEDERVPRPRVHPLAQPAPHDPASVSGFAVPVAGGEGGQRLGGQRPGARLVRQRMAMWGVPDDQVR